jgi:predicted RNA binding protein YcfA (HicA-like mRNA interferase family)
VLKIPTKVGKMKGVGMPLSGKEMVRLYEKAGWVFLRQKGSHAWMEKGKNFASIPMHKEIATGTEHSLLKKLKEEG